MGHDRKYGKVTTEFGNIPDDEPVVLFRSKDMTLLQLMWRYYTLCENAGSPQRHLDIIKNSINEISLWQTENGTRVPTSESSKDRLPL